MKNAPAFAVPGDSPDIRIVNNARLGICFLLTIKLKRKFIDKHKIT